MKIWEKDKEGYKWYETNLKNDQMERRNYYIRLYFKQDFEKHNGDNIFIEEGFWTFYQDKFGQYKPKIVIMSGYVLGEQALENDVFRDMGIEEESIDFNTYLNDIENTPF